MNTLQNTDKRMMNIISKREANKILVDSLFNPINGHTLNVEKYDNGKYEWCGSQKHYIGKEVGHIDGVHAVYVERRTNSDGAYAQVMCISE